MAEDNTLADISKMGQFINPGTTDLESFLPFGNINFQTETSNITNNNVSSTETNPNRIAQKPEVLPVKVKSFGTTKGSPTIKQQHIRDHSVGFPPYDKKQIASTTQDKLLARVAKTQHRSYQHEDNSQYAKSFMYDASSTGAHKARYKAYGQKTYDKIGFNPEINNEEVFNANTSKYDDFVRMATQAAGPMFFNGFTANPKSYKNAFGGDFGQDVDEANSYEELSSIGMSTKGGLGGFFNNVFNSLAYTGGIMTEAAMEYAAIGAIEGAIVGPEGSVVGGAVGGAAGAIKGLLSVPKSLWNMSKYGGKMLTNLKNLEKFNDAKRLFNTASRTTVNFINPLNNTAQGLKAFTSGDNLSGLARTAKTAGGLFRDVIGMNMALSEGRLEGGFVENNTYNKLYDKFWVEKNRAPTDDEQLEMRKTSKVAGFQDTWKNGLLVLYTNKLAFPGLVHGNFMAGASRNVRKVGNEFNIVYEAGKKGVKEGAYEVQKFGAKTALKGFVKPGNFVNGSLNYFKVNVVEGAQEVLQDVIGKATEDYYVNSFFDPSKANFDYSMSTLDAAYKSQISGQGFETFMSGFVMGGLLRPFTGKGFIPRSASILYNKYNMDPATYKTYMEDRNSYATNLVNVMNENHQNPVEFLNERMHNYGSQSIIARNNADDDVSTKQRFDNVEASFLSNTLTALQAGTHRILNKNMSKYLSLSDVELEETLDIKEGEGAKTRTMLTDYLKKSKNMQEQYDYAQNTFGVKKINLKDLKERTPEYDKAAIYNKAIDRGIFNLVYLNESFTNNLERVDKIVKSLNKSSLFKNMPSADFQTLLDSNKLSNTIDMLSTEIETLKSLNTPESNRNAIEKEKMLSALSLFSQKQEIYRRNISDNIESLDVLEKDVDNQNIPNKEELNNEIKDLRTTIEESGVEPKQLFKESFENLLKVLSGSDINYQKVLNDLNKKGGVDSLFNDLIDAELLKRESQILIPYINLLSQPASFYEHVERNYEWMRNLYLNRRNYYKEIINKSIIAKENNDLLKSLSDQNIYVDLEDFANWVEDPENLPDYFIEATEGNERIIPKGSIAYDNYAYIFINTANMQREPAAGEQVDIDGQFEEALEDLLAQKQKEIETADENFKRDLKTETNFSYDELLEQEQKGTEVKKPVSKLTIDRKIAEIDNFLESLISDDPALIQSRIKDFKKNTLIPKEYFNDELLADLQYKNENDQQKLKDVILPIFNSYETSFDKGQRAEVAFDLVGIAELLNNEKERLRTTTEIVTEIEPLDIINKTQSYADYQKVLDAIIKRYEEHINDLKTEFTKKGVVSEDTDNDISLSATWDEIQKQSKELYDILNDKFNSEIGTEFDDEKYDLIRNNWLETQNSVITEFNMKKAAERLIEEAEKRQFKAPIFKYIPIQKGYEIKITSKIEPLINIRNTYEKILEEEESDLTKKEKQNLTEDLKELDRVINFIREQGLQQDTTVFDKALQIFNEKIISRQSEIEKVLNDNGELIERKIDGAVAERVTKKAEELNNEITNSEPFLYSWLKDKTETEEIEGVKQDVFVKSFILSTYDAIISDESINENDKLSLFLESFKLKVLNSAKSNVFRSKNGSTLNPVKFKKIEEELTKDFSRENVVAVLQRAAYQEAADIGNMIDVLIKDFLTREGLQFKKIVKPEKMSQEAFDSLFGDRGIITNFRYGIIDGKFMIVGASDMLFDKSLFENGLVGETDLIAISADGNFSIIDVKALLGKNWSRITAENNLEKLTAKLTEEGKTETEINNNEDVIKLKKDSKFSKKLYFRIQQSIYRNLFYNMTGIMPERISLLPIEVNYDRESNLISAKLSDIVSDEDLSTYELEYFDQVESIVPLKAPIISPVSTIETTDELVEEIGASTSLKDNIGKKVLYNGEVGTLIFNDNGTFSIQIDPIKTYETKTTVTEDLSKQDFTADQDTLKIAIDSLKQNLVYEEGEFGNVDKANELKEKIAELEKQVIPTTDTKANINLDPNIVLDPLLQKAAELIVANKGVSVSLLQRKLRTLLERTNEIMAQLELLGIVGPATYTPYTESEDGTMLRDRNQELLVTSKEEIDLIFKNLKNTIDLKFNVQSTGKNGMTSFLSDDKSFKMQDEGWQIRRTGEYDKTQVDDRGKIIKSSYYIKDGILGVIIPSKDFMGRPGGLHIVNVKVPDSFNETQFKEFLKNIEYPGQPTIDKTNQVVSEIKNAIQKSISAPATANTDTKADVNVKKEQSIVEVPTKSKIIDLYYESSAVNDPSLSLNNVGLSQVKETKKVFETIIINNVSYTTRILNKNTVLINDVFYRVNYSGNDANIIASLTYDVNDAEISKLEKEELIILDSINELQNKNKTLSPSKLNEVTPESTNTFNRNVNTIGQLTMDLKNIRQTIKDLNNNNPQRTMRGGNVNDFIFAINSSPQNFKLYAGKSNDERIEDLKEISRLSYSPTLSIKLDEILAKDYPDALNKLFDDGVTSISDSELKAIKTWSNTVLEDLTDLASQVKTRGDISTDVDNQINAINNLINDLQLINLTKNGKISKRNQEESEKVFGQQTVSNRTSVPENEKSGNRKTKGVSGQKTRNVTNDEVKERINETLLNNSLLLGIIPTEEETIIVTSKKGKKFITDIKKATLDNIRTKYIEALTQIETDPSSINTTELNEAYNNRLDELNIDMSIENLEVDMVLLPKNVIFDNTNINPVRITKVSEAFVTIKDIITEETGEFNQNELKLNFIKMNEESIESEIENELTEEDIQNAEDSQIIYESFSQDTDAQSKLVDEVENNKVSEDDLLKNFNNNTKLC